MAALQPHRNKLSEVINATKTRILWVGSGDGSQQVSIVKQGHMNNCVTFYDTYEEVLQKYPASAKENIDVLKANNVQMYFSVDGMSLGESNCAVDSSHKFDVVVFFFPHVGGNTAKTKILESNRNLIRGFLMNVPKVLNEDGEVHIAVKTKGAYVEWKVPEIVGESDLEIVSRSPIDKEMFPGYVHRLTIGSNGYKDIVEDSDAQVFILKRCADVIGRAPAAGQAEQGGGERTEPIANSDLLNRIWKLEQQVALTDDQVEQELRAVMKRSPGVNVLELRRNFPKHISESVMPDTRTCNRVLYAMEKRKMVKRGNPKSGTSQKPVWHLL